VTTSQPTIAATLAQFTASLAYEAIPAAVREQAKHHFMDSIGVAFASSGFDFARKAYDGVAALGGGEYHAVGMPGTLALRDAALVNGILVHGLEFDDTSISGRLHASAVCVPCALGAPSFHMRRARKCSPPMSPAWKCAVRLGVAARGGFHAPGSTRSACWGIRRRADRGQAFRARQRAAHARPGHRLQHRVRQPRVHRRDSWTKRFEAGWPGVGAITAAMLARQGYVGPDTPYEGKFGLYRTYLSQQRAAPDLGGSLATASAALGNFEHHDQDAAGLFLQSPVINATLSVVAAHDLDPNAIRSNPRARAGGGGRYRVRAEIGEGLARDIARAIQRLLLGGVRGRARRFTLDDLDAGTLADPQILALAQKVEYGIDAQSNFPAHYSGGVEITTVDGRVLSAREDVNAGSFEQPLPPSAIEQKFLGTRSA
jgi:2-methylcitrate dehydratase PrpD